MNLSAEQCFLLLFLNMSLTFVAGGKMIYNIEKRPTAETIFPEDLKVLSSEPKEELSRDKLVDIIRTRKFFQDIFSEHLAPLKIQFGHVCENPHEWEQRFEERDLKNNRFQGKVRWGNENGNYGEHYWDLGHAGAQ